MTGTRRDVLGLLPAALLRAQTRITYRDYSRCLPDYLRQLASERYEQRRDEVAGISFVNMVLTKQAALRKDFWQLVGGRPEPTPLHVKTTGELVREGYRLEKLVYESQPGYYVSANLYLPTTGAPPYPGVLFQMGHSPIGKAYPSYQRCCQGLAKLGYVVLAFDPMGQGERVNFLRPEGSLSQLPSPDDEHTAVGRRLLLLGDTCTRWQVWDAVRSLDVLASHPSVDPARLASTGQSGGATVTMLLATVDERLSVAALAMGNTENFACAGFDPPGSTDDAEQNLLPSGSVRMDRWDLLIPFAPKPLLILVSAKDTSGTYSPRYLESGREEFAELRRIYGITGQANDVQWVETGLPHGMSYEPRLRIYNWFAHYLKREREPVVSEPATSPEPEAALRVTATGSVVRSLGSRTPQQAMRERLRALKTPAALPDLRTLLQIETPLTAPVNVAAHMPSRLCEIEAWEVPIVRSVWAPAWVFRPKTGTPTRPAILLLDARGRNAHWAEDDLCQRLAERGHVVCAADVRGRGDLTPEFGRGAAGYARSHANEDDYAWAGLLLGRSLLGQQVTDLLGVTAALLASPVLSGRPVVVAASGPLTVPALCASALEPRIARLYLTGGIAAMRQLIESENERQPLTNLVPGWLTHTDLPTVVAALAPRTVTIAGPVNALGEVIPVAQAAAFYPNLDHVRWRDRAEWSVEVLTSI